MNEADTIQLSFPKEQGSAVFKVWGDAAAGEKATGTQTVSAFVAGPAIAMVLAGQNPSPEQAQRSMGYWLEEVGETVSAMGLPHTSEALKGIADALKKCQVPVIDQQCLPRGITPAQGRDKLIDGLVDSVWTAIGALYAMLGEGGAIEAMQRVLIANAQKFPNGEAIIDPETKKYKKPEGWKEPEFLDIPCVDLS